MTKRKKFTFWFTPILYITGVILLVSLIFTAQGFTGRSKNAVIGTDTTGRTPPLNQSFVIPEDLEFAGETVPVEYFDVRESLDRELLVNGYFHSRSLFVLKKSRRYFSVIEPVLKEYNIPEDFKYLAMAESDLDNVVSPARAVGVWQLLEGTAKEYGLEVNSYVDERYDLEKSTEAACKYLLDSYEKYGNWTLAAASYNMGRNNLDSQIQRQHADNYYDLLLNDETARYVYRVLAQKMITEHPEDFGFSIAENEFYPVIPTRDVEVNTGIRDLADFAEEHATNYKMLKRFNPWLRQNTLPNTGNRSYVIRIPANGARSTGRNSRN